MDNRERFVEYVKHGGTPICSPQIGAGAGFDAKLVGKEWLSQVTVEDTLAAVGQRLKLSGMRWSEPGAEAMLHLRSLILSNRAVDLTPYARSIA